MTNVAHRCTSFVSNVPQKFVLNRNSVFSDSGAKSSDVPGGILLPLASQTHGDDPVGYLEAANHVCQAVPKDAGNLADTQAHSPHHQQHGPPCPSDAVLLLIRGTRINPVHISPLRQNCILVRIYNENFTHR